MNDLVVTSHAPVLGSGRALRTYGIVRALAALGPVDLLHPWFGADEPAPEFERMENLTLHGVDVSRGPRRALAYAHARLAGVPDGFARGISPELEASAERLGAEPGRGRIVADGPTAAAALRSLAGRRPVIYNAHNLESAFRHDAGDTGLGSRRGLERFERRVLERASESWMASRADLDAAATLAPGAALRYAPNVVDVKAITPVPFGPQKRRAVFVADFRYGPNREGMRFLVDEVFPLVWNVLPEARLALVGRGADEVARDERVELLGFVDDLRAVYATAGCALAPLLEGGGSPLKFVEAMAYGLPVVATPRAAAGLDASAGTHYLEGATPERFATAVAGVLRNGAAEVAQAGRRLVETSYSIEALTKCLQAT